MLQYLCSQQTPWMVMKEKHRFAFFAILIATLLWGMTFSFIKDAVRTLSPFNFIFWRFGIASVLLLVFFFRKIQINSQVLKYGFFLGLFLAGTVIFQTIGLTYTLASTASFITSLSVVMVALIESYLNRAWPSKYLIFSCVLALLGVGIITLGDGLIINIGDLYVLICAICFALMIILAGYASRLHRPLTLTFVQSIVVCAIAGLCAFVDTGIVIPRHTHVWVSLIFCSIFASIVAYVLQLHYQKYVSSSKVATIYALEPVFASITAALYLGEDLTMVFYIGAVMVFVAVLISEKKSKQKVIPQE